jgi:hypothetical protein
MLLVGESTLIRASGASRHHEPKSTRRRHGSYLTMGSGTGAEYNTCPVGQRDIEGEPALYWGRVPTTNPRPATSSLINRDHDGVLPCQLPMVRPVDRSTQSGLHLSPGGSM